MKHQELLPVIIDCPKCGTNNAYAATLEWIEEYADMNRGDPYVSLGCRDKNCLHEFRIHASILEYHFRQQNSKKMVKTKW